MSVSKNEIKIPTKEGLAEARKKLKEILHKAPSPELVKIIEEVTHDDKKHDDGMAARGSQYPEAGV